MAGKRVISRQESPLSTVQQTSCGGCAKAFGYCVKGYDGTPVFCRCPLKPGIVIITTTPSCACYEKRSEPVPEVFPFCIPEDL